MRLSRFVCQYRLGLSSFITPVGIQECTEDAAQQICVPTQAGVAPARARLLRERQKTIAYEDIHLEFKDGDRRGAEEVAQAEDASVEDPDTIICDREKAL